jgi:hypothetical protein
MAQIECQNPRVDRWRARVERWLVRNPWRGLPLKERRRLERLSRSGQRIEDPQDVARIRAYVEQAERLFQGRLWKIAFVFLPWLVVPFGLAGVVVRAIQGNLAHSISDGVVVVAYLYAVTSFRRRRRAMASTVEANGCAESVA